MRHPLFGIGCAGGVAGVTRAARLLGPRERALLVSVELCSQTFRIRDGSLVSLVGAALFGDGAAAVVMEGDAIATGGARVVAGAAELFPQTENVMGWEFADDGMKLVMSADIPGVVRELAVPAIERFRAGRRVDHWVLHPGGPKVLAAYGLGEGAIAPARTSLRTVGNLSSAAVLFILSGVAAKSGETGLMAAVGPGFGIEMAFLQW
jgi:alkylresorcinol/alkylpyrone synthase